MKDITNFLFENISNIFEANFESADYTKHNFKYAKMVIADLLNGKDIGLGAHNDSYAKLDQNEVEDFCNNYSDENFPTTADDFNLMIKKYKSFPKWRSICKDNYSGQNTVTKGQRAEGLVCYMFNEKNPDLEAFKKEAMPDLTDDWIESSRMTVDFINKQKGVSDILWTSENYIACRVDGDDFRLDSKYSFAAEVTSIFTGTVAMKKIFKIDCKDLYSGNKDIWNKADIVLVHKEMGKHLIENIKKKGILNGEMLNSCLIEYTKEGVIVPISLKMLENENAHLTSVNIIEGEPVDMIKSVKHVRIADKYSNQYTGNIDIVCESVEGKEILITFRSDTNGANGLSVEPKEKGGSARFGKAIAVIKGILNLKGQDYYVIKDSNKDAISEIENYGFDVMIKSKSNYDVAQPELRERACCAGFLGLLESYKNYTKKPINKDFPVKFANFCMFCAVGLNGKGAFYKISN